MFTTFIKAQNRLNIDKVDISKFAEELGNVTKAQIQQALVK